MATLFHMILQSFLLQVFKIALEGTTFYFNSLNVYCMVFRRGCPEVTQFVGAGSISHRTRSGRYQAVPCQFIGAKYGQAHTE